MTRVGLGEEIRRIYTREHPVFHPGRTFNGGSDVATSRAFATARGRRRTSLLLDERAVAQLAETVASDLPDTPLDEAMEVPPAVINALGHIRRFASRQLDDQAAALMERWQRMTTAIARLQADIARRERNVHEAEAALEQTEYSWRDTLGQLRAAPHRQLRTMPPLLYGSSLITAAVLIGVFNAQALRVLRLDELQSLLLAFNLATVFTVGIHLVPQGLRRSDHRRDWTFLTSVAVLSLLVLSVGTLGLMWQEMSRRGGQGWWTVVLVALGSFSALLAAFLYQTDEAIALRRAKSDISKAQHSLREATTLLQAAENELNDARYQRYAATDAGLRSIRALSRDAERLQASFFVVLRGLRPDVRWVTPESSPDLSIPDSARALEEWLRREQSGLHDPYSHGDTGFAGA